MFHSGDVIGPYALLRTLGRGAFGEVWLAERRSSLLTVQVALKLPLDSAADLDVVRNEAQVWLKASGHPNIVPVLDAEVYDGQVVIASEYVAGGSLEDWLKQHGAASGRPPPSIVTAVSMLQSILAGLGHLHANRLIHRDLKPGNVLLQNSAPRLTDFGLTRILKASAHTTNLAGTPGYMAPEAFQGHYSAASDLWAAGMILHELLVGALPYPEMDFYVLLQAITSDAPVPVAADLPAAIRSFHAKALAKPPGDRYASAAEMSEALASAVAAGPMNVEALPPRPAARPPVLTSRRNPRTLLRWLALGVGLLSLGGALYGVQRMITRRAASPNHIGVARRSDSAPDAKAKALTVEAEHLLTHSNNDANLAAIADLEKAVQIDPSYAEAHGELAMAYVIRGFLFRPDDQELGAKASAEMAAALDLDPDLAEAHFVRGRILWSPKSHFDHELAIREFHAALKSRPNMSEPHNWLGLVYLHIGLFENADTEFKEALRFNPENSMAKFSVGQLDSCKLDYPKTIDDLRSIDDYYFPALIGYYVASAQAGLGERTEAAGTLKECLLQQKGKDTGGVLHSMQAVLYALQHNKEKALKEIAAARVAGKGFGHFHHAEYTIASAYALIGDHIHALDALKHAAENGFPCYPLFRDDPNLNNLRNDAQFKAFMAQQEKQWLAFKKRHPTP